MNIPRRITKMDFRNKTLSEELIEKFQDKVSCEDISKKQNLSELFIEKYYYKLNLENLKKNKNINYQEIEKYHLKNWSEYISQNKNKYVNIVCELILSQEVCDPFRP